MQQAWPLLNISAKEKELCKRFPHLNAALKKKVWVLLFFYATLLSAEHLIRHSLNVMALNSNVDR